MPPLEMKLTANGMANIPSAKIQNDFEFVVGGHRYGCPWFVADFISPAVARLHALDTSLSEFCIEIDGPHEQFNQWLSLGFGSTIQVSEANLSFFCSICRELGNIEAYESLSKHFQRPLTTSNAFEQLRGCDFFDCDRQPIIEFIASHFFEFGSSIESAVSSAVFDAVLSHPSLQVLSEDALYDIISSRFDLDADYFALVEYIRFEYVSADRVSHFTSWLSDHFDRLTFGVWTSICSRLKYPISPTSPDSRAKEKEDSRPLDVPAPTEGIIASLTRRYGGSLHDKGIVSITGTPFDKHLNHAPKNALDLNGASFFHSGPGIGQWLCYDFKQRRIRPTHYTIYGYLAQCLRSWVVEGSLDNREWVALDTHDDDAAMSDVHPIGTFALSSPSNLEFRFIRLRLTGKDATGASFLIVHGFEIFGVLIE
jgi:hypothetical protein